MLSFRRALKGRDTPHPPQKSPKVAFPQLAPPCPFPDIVAVPLTPVLPGVSVRSQSGPPAFPAPLSSPSSGTMAPFPTHRSRHRRLKSPHTFPMGRQWGSHGENHPHPKVLTFSALASKIPKWGKFASLPISPPCPLLFLTPHRQPPPFNASRTRHLPPPPFTARWLCARCRAFPAAAAKMSGSRNRRLHLWQP